MTWFRHALMGLALLAVAVACGGGDDNASPESTTTAPEPTTITTTTTVASFTGAGSGEFCAQAQQAEEKLTGMAQAPSSPEAARNIFTSVADSLQALADQAPAEIKADVAVIARAYRELVRDLEALGWQGSEMAGKIATRINQPDVRDASGRLETYRVQVCGKAPPTTAPR